MPRLLFGKKIYKKTSYRKTRSSRSSRKKLSKIQELPDLQSLEDDSPQKLNHRPDSSAHNIDEETTSEELPMSKETQQKTQSLESGEILTTELDNFRRIEDEVPTKNPEFFLQQEKLQSKSSKPIVLGVPCKIEFTLRIEDDGSISGSHGELVQKIGKALESEEVKAWMESKLRKEIRKQIKELSREGLKVGVKIH